MTDYLAELRRKRARKLKKLEITELSLVDKGANEGARVTFFKRAEDNTTMDDQNFLTAETAEIAIDELGAEYAKANNVSKAAGVAAVLKTDEGRQLYADYDQATRKMNPNRAYATLQKRAGR